MVQTTTIDPKGRLTLPKKMRDMLGITQETEVIPELTDIGLMIKLKQAPPPLTAKLAALDLPVGDWEEMETEIEEGRLS